MAGGTGTLVISTCLPDTFCFEGDCVPVCVEDLDDDFVVGISDLLQLLAVWGNNPQGPPDFDGDGVVGVRDLLTLLTAWGPCPR